MACKFGCILNFSVCWILHENKMKTKVNPKWNSIRSSCRACLVTHVVHYLGIITDYIYKLLRSYQDFIHSDMHSHVILRSPYIPPYQPHIPAIPIISHSDQWNIFRKTLQFTSIIPPNLKSGTCDSKIN